MNKFVTIILILFSLVSGAIHVVATDGNDANPGSVSEPWLHVDSALSWLDPGDTLQIRQGTYTFLWEYDNRYKGSDGTEANPIVITHYPSELCTLATTVGEDSCIFDLERDYYIIDGLHFEFKGRAIRLGNNTPIVGTIIKNCTFNMSLGGDNTGGVYVSGGANTTLIYNCTFTGPSKDTTGIHNNTTGVICFNSINLTIRKNIMKNSPRGLYYKHGSGLPEYPTPTGIVIDSNLTFDCLSDGMMLNIASATVSNNIIGPRTGGLRVCSSNGGPRGDHNTFSRNIISSGSMSLNQDDSVPNNNLIINNIFNAKNLRLLPTSTTDTNKTNSTDTNTYYNSTITFYGVERTLAQWQTYYGQDQNSTTDAPTFHTEFSDTTFEYYFGPQFTYEDTTGLVKRRSRVSVNDTAIYFIYENKASSQKSVSVVVNKAGVEVGSIASIAPGAIDTVILRTTCSPCSTYVRSIK
jgi:hypothetical protein